MIQRYEIDAIHGGIPVIVPMFDGAWVKWSDVQAVIARITAPMTRKEIEFVATFAPEGVTDDDVDALIGKADEVRKLRTNT